MRVAIITGLGGIGKSTLGTLLARRLEPDGFHPIAVSGAAGVPIGLARVLQVLGDSFLAVGLSKEHALLRNQKVPVEDRSRYVVSVLNQHRFFLVLDNLDASIDPVTGDLSEPLLKDFLVYLTRNAAGASRVLITTRFLPSSMAEFVHGMVEERLGDWSQAEFLKFVLGDPTVERRYSEGILGAELIQLLYRKLGGAPAFARQIREVLKTIDVVTLMKQLNSFGLPVEQATPGTLQRLRDEYCKVIALERLYAGLSEQSRSALSRSAVYRTFVDLAGLQAVTGLESATLSTLVLEWAENALAYSEERENIGPVWAIYGVLRDWLMIPPRLSPEDRRLVQRKAGGYLWEQERAGQAARLGLSPLDCLYEARSHFIEARDLEAAVAATDRIGGPLKWRGLYDELERVNIELLELGSHPSPLCWIGTATFHKRIYERSEEYFQRSLALDSTRDTAAAALHGLGMIDLERGRLEEAKARFHSAREIQTKVGDAEGEAATWHSLASIALEQGDLENAHHGLSNALNIYRRLRDRAGEVGSLHGLGTVAAEKGNMKLAQDCFSEALDLSESFAYPFGKALSLCDLASLDLRQGRHEKARDRYDEALGIATDIGDKIVGREPG